MFAKIGLAIVVAICAAVPLSRIDYHELYNEMYPVNGLKRDVLGLCTATKATFVRALRSDRIGCYDSMPDSVDLAIGWVRTSERLALMKPPTAIERAEKMLAEALMRRRLGLPGPQFTGYIATPEAARPCRATALASLGANADIPLGESDERLARRIAKGDDAALAALGLPPRSDARDSAGTRGVPVMPLGAGNPAAAPVGLGDPAAQSAAAGCGTRA